MTYENAEIDAQHYIYLQYSMKCMRTTVVIIIIMDKI